MHLKDTSEMRLRKQAVLSAMKKGGIIDCSWVHYKDSKLVESIALTQPESILQTQEAGTFSAPKSTLVPELKTTDEMHMASLSKPVFAYLVLQLIKAGKLTLDERLANTCLHEWFNNLKGPQRQYLNEVTVQMVLQHRDAFWHDEASFCGKPGTKFSYTGVGMLWLQQVIESKMGKDFESLAQQYVFSENQLDMKNSTYVSQQERAGIKDAKQKEPTRDPTNSLRSTPEDYARFVQACLKLDGLGCDAFEFEPDFTMKKDAWAVARKVKPKTLDLLSWGLLFGLQKIEGDVKGWHNGDMNFTRSFVVFDVNKQGKGDIFVFAARSNDQKHNRGFSLLETLLPKGIKIQPVSEYMQEKLGFALDQNGDWDEQEDKRMGDIRKLLPTLKNKGTASNVGMFQSQKKNDGTAALVPEDTGPTLGKT